VEIVERLNDLYNERDFDELRKLMDPDFVWDMSRVEMPDSVRHAGLTALRPVR
jgi:hypothetical protein